MSTEWKVQVGKDSVSAAFEAAAADNDHREGPAAIFVFAHGAGGNMNDAGVRAGAAALRKHGIATVRFNFLYRERGSSRPDQMPRLMETTAAVADKVASELSPTRLIIGGRSMGGRAASMLAAADFNAQGLLLLAYPLHPPGQPEKLRSAHLADIRMPVLCFSGTRDDFCKRELMKEALRSVTAPWDMRWVEGADHGFHVLKRSGRTDSEVLEEIGSATEAWVKTLPLRK